LLIALITAFGLAATGRALASDPRLPPPDARAFIEAIDLA
jgi:hypothetical protein